MLGHIRFILTYPIYLTALLLQRAIGSPRDREDGSWCDRLEYGRLACGLPAIAALIISVGSAAWAVALSGRLETSYANRLHGALASGDFDTAKLCSERLLAANPGSDDYSFLLAKAFEGLGEIEHANALMQRLAPADSGGFPPAQLWIVERRLRSGVPFGPADLREMSARLIRIRDDARFGEAAARILADVYFRTGRGALVLNEPALAQAAEGVPDLRLALAELRAARVSPQVTKAVAEDLAGEFRRRLRENPDDIESRLLLARAQLLAGDLEGVATTLREGMSLGDDRRLGEMVAAIELDRFRLAVRRGAPVQMRKQLAALALAAIDKYAAPSDATTLERARLYAALDDAKQAEAAYLQVFKLFPVTRVEWAEFLSKAGREAEAQAQYAAVLEWYQGATAVERLEVPQARIAGPMAAVRSGKFEQAATWLDAQSRDGSPDAPVMKALLAQCYVAWSDDWGKRDPSSGTQRLELLRKGLESSPFDPTVMQRLLTLAGGKDDAARKARELFTELIASGKAPASAYLLAGTDALARGDRKLGIAYLERANELNPGSYVALNNLAWGLAFGPMPDLERALTVIDEAARKAPQDPNVRDTRGRILAKLKRWNEALVDLEAAGPALRGNAEYHTALAEVYEALGMKAPASKHREAARTGIAPTVSTVPQP